MIKFLLTAILTLLSAGLPSYAADKRAGPVPSAPDPQVLRVYMSGNYLPLHGLRGKDRIGIEAEIAEALAEAMGRRVEYFDRERAGMSSLEAVARGRVDVALNAITPTPERAELVDFTEPIAAVPLRLARFNHRIESLKDLAGKKVAVPRGLVESQLGGLDAAIVPYGSLAEAVNAAKGLHAYAVAAEEPALADAIPHKWMVMSHVEAGRSPVSMAVPKGKKAEYDAVLARISGTTAKIREKWEHYRVGFLGVSVGRRTACAITEYNELACFGDQEHLLTPPAGRFMGLSMGAEHACAIRDDFTVTCWGRNEHGQANAKPGMFKRVTAGNDHTCGLLQDGSLACWGANRYGQAKPPEGAYQTVGSGDGFSCALGLDGRIVCWGRSFAEIPSGVYKSLSVGPMGACAAKAAKFEKTVCWTIASYPPDGWESGWNRTVKPREYISSVSMATMSVGFDVACGIEERDDRPKCLGAAGYVPEVEFTQVEAGQGMACGVRPSRSLECWGDIPSDMQQVRAAGGAVWNISRASRPQSPFLVGICGNGGTLREVLLHPERGLLAPDQAKYDESGNSTWYRCSGSGPQKFTFPAPCGEEAWIAATVPLKQKRTTLKIRDEDPGATSEELAACDLIGLPGSLWLTLYSYDPEKAGINVEEAMAEEAGDRGTGALRPCTGLVLTWRGSPGIETLYLEDCPAQD